jgi:uncharacterized membrane protein YbhN (UPF0104 family)
MLLWGGLAALALSLAVLVRSLDSDLASDELLRVVGLALPVGLLLAATASHYVASGIALQAAAGVRLPARERYLSQLAAAAANRLTPGGVGAAALNARYLAQRGSSGGTALAAIAAMQVLGAIADFVLLATLFGVGSMIGVVPAGSWSRLVHEASLPVMLLVHQPWLLGVVAMVAAVLVHRRRARTVAPSTGLRGGITSVITAIRDLSKRPRDVATLMGASAWTTLVLGVGFAASVASVAGPSAWHSFLTLMIGYMVGTAVGNAAPVPSGIGTTDTALVGVVAASGVATHQAVIAVLIFRVVSFWMPAALGLIAGAALRRRGAY